jgi:hypothetical protein
LEEVGEAEDLQVLQHQLLHKAINQLHLTQDRAGKFPEILIGKELRQQIQ